MGEVNSRQIDWTAHDTQKTKTKPCAHTNQKHKHIASKTNHQPCAKQDTNTQLMRILISHVFTQVIMTTKHPTHEKHKLHATQHKTYHQCTQPIKTGTASTTPQNTRGQKSAPPSELEPTHSHNETEHRARVSEPRHETETQDMSAGIRTPCSNTRQGMQTR